jgi:hypothetical protein
MPRNLRIAIVGFGAVLAIGLVGILYAGHKRQTSATQVDGVVPLYPVAPLAVGQTVCQEPIGLSDDADRVVVSVGAQGRPGPALRISVTTPSGRLLGQGRVAPGWLDIGKPRVVSVGRLHADQLVSVCVTDTGPRRAFVFGDLDTRGPAGQGPLGVRPTPSNSVARIDGVQIPGDLAVTLLGPKPHSLIARVPAMFRHAAHFRPGFVGRGLYWALLVAMLVLVPLMLLGALRRTLRED